MARVPRYICDVCGAEESYSEGAMPVHSNVNIGGYARKWEDTCPRCSYVLNQVLDKTVHALQARQKLGRKYGVKVTIELEKGEPYGAPNRVVLNLPEKQGEEE